jgi:ABC-type uncharacterized transport system auxiliary subunit
MKYLYLVLLLVLVLSGCKKSKENKLIGSWDLLPQYAADTANPQVYTFDASYKLIRTINDSISDTANYEIVQEFNKFYIDIQNLNKTVLILQSFSPFMRKEFTKAE